ncbi:HAD family hydrolase [bacterium]|nr:HAD family hydrolase [bacterium]
MKRIAAFLDRDGVINRRKIGGYITTPDEFILLPKAPEGIALLNSIGVLVIVVTNQRGIERGVMTEEELKRVHQFMIAELKKRSARIDDILFCPHSTGYYRKPSPGMILAAAERHQVDLPSSFTIGDTNTDILAGKAAGTKTILINPEGETDIEADFYAENLYEAAELIRHKIAPHK